MQNNSSPAQRQASSFNPSRECPGGCFTCRYFYDLAACGAVRCARNGYMRSTPENGCAFWEREPGSDDELPRDPPVG